jgi:3-hydroxy-9,10-secoandrosta-1,3,5(10)-triene-9,17-dione monooxygenase reductase component
MAMDKSELRRVMGHFSTGVTIVTTCDEAGVPYGLTANALSSVSLAPPLLLVCIDKGSKTYPCFEQSGVFTVNILADHQEALSRRFAASGGDKFEGVSYRLGTNRAPIIDGALAYLECKVTRSYDGGDHTIYIGEILRAETGETGKPLLFYRGGYRRFGD